LTSAHAIAVLPIAWAARRDGLSVTLQAELVVELGVHVRLLGKCSSRGYEFGKQDIRSFRRDDVSL